MMELEEPNPNHEWGCLIVLIIGAIIFFLFILPNIGPIRIIQGK